MALDNTFKALDIREVLDATHMRGKNITFLNFPAFHPLKSLQNLTLR